MIVLSDDELSTLSKVAKKGRPWAFIDGTHISKQIVGHLQQIHLVVTELGVNRRLYAQVTPLGAQALAGAHIKVQR